MSRKNQRTDPFNGILLVDKPSAWTSHDIVAKIRSYFSLNKVGHGGTLDPLATGLLVILIGKATKLSNSIMSGDKIYNAEVKFGLNTSTQDIDGKIIKTSDSSMINSDKITKTLPLFTGEIKQLPPMVSAIKKNGIPLYKLARKGIEIEREERSIKINKLELLDFNNPYANFKIICSKGTYVRTLANDIGDKLGCGGCLTKLRREASDPFTIDQAHSLELILSKTRDTLKDISISIEEISI